MKNVFERKFSSFSFSNDFKRFCKKKFIKNKRTKNLLKTFFLEVSVVVHINLIKIIKYT